MVSALGRKLWFPDPRQAERGEHDGLVAVGGDFSVPRLLLAYRSGVFPWTARPPTWWSPDPRGIFELDQFQVSRSLERVIRRQVFEISIDRAFQQVIESCADPKCRGDQRDGGWITREFITAYTELHRAGHAHSVECWRDGELAGGIYGVAVGGLFAGESMFHRVSDASKVALFHLHRHLRERGFALFDIQMLTPITRQLGAVEISREDYLARLANAVELKCSF